MSPGDRVGGSSRERPRTPPGGWRPVPSRRPRHPAGRYQRGGCRTGRRERCPSGGHDVRGPDRPRRTPRPGSRARPRAGTGRRTSSAGCELPWLTATGRAGAADAWRFRPAAVGLTTARMPQRSAAAGTSRRTRTGVRRARANRSRGPRPPASRRSDRRTAEASRGSGQPGFAASTTVQDPHRSHGLQVRRLGNQPNGSLFWRPLKDPFRGEDDRCRECTSTTFPCVCPTWTRRSRTGLTSSRSSRPNTPCA